jgi:hypothetical protein
VRLPIGSGAADGGASFEPVTGQSAGGHDARARRDAAFTATAAVHARHRHP